ncbi:Basic form of pathogenesis-related protein 1 [Vitis vinifera]|uniref:Basic form of pathogenesis-related protein 1 n=1 Tax=Vitis vinifera TaxID=29760 RepID=A0A438JMQ9_VITVI|nr:Basic form of pathogenesis-related protein 1 [Vitis vinifera]
MGLCKNISVALACLMGLALVHTSYAQNSQQDYLNAHNTNQAQFGVRSMTWNNTIASYAQNYANKWIGDCNLRHSNGSSGENFAKGSVSLGYARAHYNNGWWFIICNYYPPNNYIRQHPY